MRKLVLATALLVFIGLAAILYLSFSSPSQHTVLIDTARQPSLGSIDAPIEMVVFEEPKCIDCRDYHVGVYPFIKSEFIDTGYVRYVSIGVSFLPHSFNAVNASLFIYHRDPSLYFAFQDYLFHHQPDEEINWATPDLLVEFAKCSCVDLPLDQLKQCIEKGCYSNEVIQNTHYARELMGGRIFTPTIYINGVKLNEISLEDIRAAIQHLLSP